MSFELENFTNGALSVNFFRTLNCRFVFAQMRKPKLGLDLLTGEADLSINIPLQCFSWPLAERLLFILEEGSWHSKTKHHVHDNRMYKSGLGKGQKEPSWWTYQSSVLVPGKSNSARHDGRYLQWDSDRASHKQASARGLQGGKICSSAKGVFF